jgi:hypothetical protein
MIIVKVTGPRGALGLTAIFQLLPIREVHIITFPTFPTDKSSEKIRKTDKEALTI